METSNEETKRSREEFDNNEPNDDDNDWPPPFLITYDENTMRFGRVLEEASVEVDAAKNNSD